jgi:hypothetical protein
VRLILQCALCGTANAVGSTECGTCRAAGFENLRLLFECQHCFRVGLVPSCEECSKLLPLDPAYEVVPDPVNPDELARQWGVGTDRETASDSSLTGEPIEPDLEEDMPMAEIAPMALEDKEKEEAKVAVEDDRPRQVSPR